VRSDLENRLIELYGYDYVLNAKRVTYRVHGQHGELKKPMVHRFEVPGGISMWEHVSRLMAKNIMKMNPLYLRLARKGK
jgi:hypothetical protein